MRQNLAESWVTDAADGLIGDEMEHLEEMERNLRWLMKTQQAADTERQLVERLERQRGDATETPPRSERRESHVGLGPGGSGRCWEGHERNHGISKRGLRPAAHWLGRSAAHRLLGTSEVDAGLGWWFMDGLWMAWATAWMFWAQHCLRSRKCSHICNHLPRSGSPLFQQMARDINSLITLTPPDWYFPHWAFNQCAIDNQHHD